jgi:hypothetical protein
MNFLLLGAIAGAAFGAVTLALMWPMTFPDRRTALTAAFVERFAIGLVIGIAQVPVPGWLLGAALGLLLSVGSALLTRAYKPILLLGALGGALIGGLVHGWR